MTLSRPVPLETLRDACLRAMQPVAHADFLGTLDLLALLTPAERERALLTYRFLIAEWSRPNGRWRGRR